MSQTSGDLLQQAIAAARAGQKEEAKRLLIQVLKANPRSEQAWIWMSATVDTPAERIHCLKQVLAINPDNELAQKGLRALGALEEEVSAPSTTQPEITSEPKSEPELESPPAEPEPAAIEEEITADEAVEATIEADIEPEPEPTSAPSTELEAEIESVPEPDLEPEPRPDFPAPAVVDGVPIVSEEAVAWAQREVDDVLAEIDKERQTGSLQINWGTQEELREKTRRSGIDLRPSPMMLAIVGAVVLVAAIVFLASQILRNMQVEPVQADITPSPSPTITLTSFPSSTPAPSRTPTATGGPPITEPTIAPGSAPRGQVGINMTPTSPYIATPHPANPAMGDAITAFNRKRYEEVLNLLERARSGSDDPIDAYYFEAMSYLHLGDVEAAQDAVDAGMALGEAFAPLHYVQGEIHRQEGATERAQLSYERAIEIDAAYVPARLALAELLTQDGQYEAALAQVEAARSGRSTYDVRTLVTASRVYLASGDPENAAAHANLAYYIDPESEEVVVAQGQARLALGLEDLAVITMEDYLREVNGRSAAVWALLGQAYAQQDRTQDAQNAYAQALQLSEDSTSALIGRGQFYLQRGEYQSAFEDLSSAIENGADSNDVLSAHARAAYEIGQLDEALLDLETLRERVPDDAESAVLYVRILLTDEQYEEVAEVATEVLNTINLDFEQQADMFEARARADYHLGNYQQAQADLEEALFVGETGTRLYYNALIHAELDNVEQAIIELEWLAFWDQIYNYPFSEDLQETLENLRDQQVEAEEDTP